MIVVVLITQAARKSGFSVLYGDGSRPAVLQTAGITMPKAVMVMYTDRGKSVEAVERLRLAFPGVIELISWISVDLLLFALSQDAYMTCCNSFIFHRKPVHDKCLTLFALYLDPADTYICSCRGPFTLA